MTEQIDIRHAVEIIRQHDHLVGDLLQALNELAAVEEALPEDLPTTAEVRVGGVVVSTVEMTLVDRVNLLRNLYQATPRTRELEERLAKIEPALAAAQLAVMAETERAFKLNGEITAVTTELKITRQALEIAEASRDSAVAQSNTDLSLRREAEARTKAHSADTARLFERVAEVEKCYELNLDILGRTAQRLELVETGWKKAVERVMEFRTELVQRIDYADRYGKASLKHELASMLAIIDAKFTTQARQDAAPFVGIE